MLGRKHRGRTDHASVLLEGAIGQETTIRNDSTSRVPVAHFWDTAVAKQQLNIAGNANGQTALGSCPTCAKVREREMGKGVGGEDREMRHTRSVYACFILDMDSCV